MVKIIIKKQWERRFLFSNLIFFILFMFMYTLVDSFNLGYGAMKERYGLFLPVLNIFLNVIMSLISALLIGFSTALLKMTGKEGKGSIFSGISVLFGILTYGCTPCVIAFFASLGLTFSVAALPLAGLPYKFISLALVLLGMVWMVWQIKHIRCKTRI